LQVISGIRPYAAVLPRFRIERFESVFSVRDEPFQAVFLNPVGDVLREEVLLILTISKMYH
jgi:hypothetical protein